MKLSTSNRPNSGGFTLVEVAIAVGVVALFGLATFQTNERLLLALKAQKETTAVTTAMQWRMETFRATAFSNIANKDYVKNNILKVRKPTDANGNAILDSTGTAVDPFAVLGSITEQLTIGIYPADGSTNTVISWDKQHNGGQDISQMSNTTIANAEMLKVDVLETWTSANGRQRQRQLSTIVTLGNIGK